MRSRRLILLTLLICGLTPILPCVALAEWPERTVKIIVTFLQTARELRRPQRHLLIHLNFRVD